MHTLCEFYLKIHIFCHSKRTLYIRLVKFIALNLGFCLNCHLNFKHFCEFDVNFIESVKSPTPLRMGLEMGVVIARLDKVGAWQSTAKKAVEFAILKLKKDKKVPSFFTCNQLCAKRGLGVVFCILKAKIQTKMQRKGKIKGQI